MAKEISSLMEVHDIGAGWYAVTFSDGRMTLRTEDDQERIELPADSVETLRNIFKNLNAA